LETLDNMIWRAFAGSQRHLTAGTERARRFAKGYSPLIAFADPLAADFEEITPFCAPGEKFYCGGWTGPEPAGWKIELDTTMCPMLFTGSAPAADDSLPSVRLAAEHVPQMMELTTLTRPGPFGDRTIELGEWHGVFDGELLIAMAGERLQAGKLHEISGVCTRPGFEGRGLARRLTGLVLRKQLARGETPFLHVAAKNARALELYRRMGFVVQREVAMRIISRTE
jgi:ribosomal protein S18 acetylase RimI-like enzyme